MAIDEIINKYISNEIKKCPCCNGEAKINHYTIVLGSEYLGSETLLGSEKIWISCTNDYCEIQTRPIFIYNEDATNVKAANILDMIKRWNRRVKKEDKNGNN